MKFNGIVTAVTELEAITLKSGEQSCKKIIVVEEENVEFPSVMAFNLYGDKASQNHNVVGDRVTVDFSTKVNANANGKFFTEIRAWRVSPNY